MLPPAPEPPVGSRPGVKAAGGACSPAAPPGLAGAGREELSAPLHGPLRLVPRSGATSGLPTFVAVMLLLPPPLPPPRDANRVEGCGPRLSAEAGPDGLPPPPPAAKLQARSGWPAVSKRRAAKGAGAEAAGAGERGCSPESSPARLLALPALLSLTWRTESPGSLLWGDRGGSPVAGELSRGGGGGRSGLGVSGPAWQ